MPIRLKRNSLKISRDLRNCISMSTVQWQLLHDGGAGMNVDSYMDRGEKQEFRTK
jgi:hypothetical protein